MQLLAVVLPRRADVSFIAARNVEHSGAPITGAWGTSAPRASTNTSRVNFFISGEVGGSWPVSSTDYNRGIDLKDRGAPWNY